VSSAFARTGPRGRGREPRVTAEPAVRAGGRRGWYTGDIDPAHTPVRGGAPTRRLAPESLSTSR